MNDDLISRQAAIDAYLETVSSLCVDEGDGMLTACARDRDILEMLENLPSVQPKTGRWKPLQHLGKEYTWLMECSCCGKGRIGSNIALTYNYCPYCGAKMEGEAE